MQDKKEEVKNYDFVFDDSKSIKGSLKPSNLITSGSKFKTIFLQKIDPQNEEIFQNKSKLQRSEIFDTYSPFQIFPNISIPNKYIYRGPTSNYFFDAIFLAYALHGELVLSPDDIWLQIMFSFSNYVDLNAEKLRNKIVDFEGKKALVVLYNETDPNFQDFENNDNFRWDSIMKSFSDLIKNNTKNNIGETMECNFSSTGIIEKAAGQIAMMHSFEKYFDYYMGVCGCGITKLHMLGEREDWVNLKKKTKKLIEYDVDQNLKIYINNLKPILEQFINTYDEKVDLKFWNTIVNQFEGFLEMARPSRKRSFVPENFINGWIINFFLFDKKNNFMTEIIRNIPLEKPKNNDFGNMKKSELGIELKIFLLLIVKFLLL